MTIKKFKIHYDARGKILNTTEVEPDLKPKPTPPLHAVSQAKSSTPRPIQTITQKKTALVGDDMLNNRGVQFILQEISRGVRHPIEQAKVAMFEFYKVATPLRSNKKIQKSVDSAIEYLVKKGHIK